jgi:hypothetical protein
LNVDLLVTPFFKPDSLPSPKRFFLYNPFSDLPFQREVEPPITTGNTEAALRVYRRIAGFDVSAYGYRGFWRTPAIRLDSNEHVLQPVRFYPRLAVVGASAQRNALQGVVSLEAGRYDSNDDRDGTNPSIPNSQWRALAAYQRQLARELTVNVQGYAEIMSRYKAYRKSLPPGSPVGDRLRGVFSLRVTQYLSYQSWKLSAFLAYSPTDADYFLQPEISHRLTDKLSATLGANTFGGRRDTTFFGQMRQDDNVYLSTRFDF